MSVTVTELAAKEVKRFIDEGDYDDGAVLRASTSLTNTMKLMTSRLNSTVFRLLSTAKRLCTWKVQPLITTKASSNVVSSSTTPTQSVPAGVVIHLASSM